MFPLRSWFFVALLFICFTSLAWGVPPGTHVATIEIDAPAIDPFTIHATIPIIDGEYTMAMRQSGTSPYGIVDTSGTVVPAQTILVTRAANGNADVVEVVARVSRGTASPGTRLQYKVVAYQNSHSPWLNTAISVQGVIGNNTTLDADVRALANQPLKVRAHDVFGNVYEADLTQQYSGSPKLFK